MKRILVLVCFFSLISCDFIVREGISSALSEDEPEVLEGNFFKLKDANVSVFLPKGFVTITDEELSKSYNLIEDEKTRNFYKKELELRKSNLVSYYNFYNHKLESEVYVNSLPYMPFDKKSARQVLYYLRKGHERYQRATGIYHNKIRAVYLGDAYIQIFKAEYRLSGYNSHDENQEEYHETFKTVYLISNKKKTLLLNILTPNNVAIDPFIRKIKF